MLKLKRLKEESWLIGILFLALIPGLCEGSILFNEIYEAEKLKTQDMAYGELLTSIELGGRYSLKNPMKKQKMLCTTERPLPTLDPSYVPNDSCDKEEPTVYTEPEVETTTPTTQAAYNGPTSTSDNPFYIDDY